MQTKTSKKKRSSSSKILEASVLTAVFTAMAVVMSTMAGVRLPLLGADGLKISFGGIFTFLPAIMFGPIYGGIASALCDIIGCIIKPSGAYIPWFTIVAFLGGFIKGLVWQLLTKKKEWHLTGAFKAVLTCLFALILVFGCVFSASLNADGLTSGIVSKQESLPFEDAMKTKELSFFSDIAASLAQYNHDTLTVTKITPSESGDFVIPKKVVSGETSLSVKKINASVLNTEGLVMIYIPSSCTGVTVPEGFKFTNTALTVVFEKPSEDMTKFVTEYSVSNHTYGGDAFPSENLSVSAFAKSYSTDTIKINSSDAYRKNLAGYINFMTVGFILTGVLGLVFILIGVILAKTTKGNERMSLYMKVLPAVLLSGLTVTTINTYVLLKLFYAGRLFWVLYIPRLAEEFLMSVIQGYIITVLLTVLSSHSVFRKLIGINSKSKTE